MSDAAVSATDLTRSFGRFVAVDHVSFEVAPGEIFGFLGPNGAGKTTTIKMLTGLLPPTSGRGTVAGFELGREAAAIKRRIGYMSQLFSLYTTLSVEENIRFFGALNGVPRHHLGERRDWVLEMAGLTGQERRLTAELPLGIKQRLALGCAVLHEPPILFLDEPTSGVDPLSRRRFWALINTLAGGGTTVFVTTHYMEEAESCHRLALMNRGRLIALDRPAALKAGAKDPLFEVETTATIHAVAALEGATGITRAGLFGRRLHVSTLPGEGEAAIRTALARAGLEAASVRPISPNLEDVFIALVAASGGAVAG